MMAQRIESRPQPPRSLMSLIAENPIASVVLSFLAGQFLTVMLFGVCFSARRAEKITS